MGRRVAVTCHAAGRRQRYLALTVGLERGVREIGRRRRPKRIGMAPVIAGPLRREQHVVFPDGALQERPEWRVQICHFLEDEARDHLFPDHLAPVLAFELQALIRIPRGGLRRRVILGGAIRLARRAEEVVARQQIAAGDEDCPKAISDWVRSQLCPCR
jgi:hypothetical protein